MKASELRVQPRTENGNRSAVAVVGGIDHELVVQCDAPERQRKAVVGFDDLLGTGMRQLSIADENAEPAGVEKRYSAEIPLMTPANPKVAPLRALESESGSHRAVDIGELVGFDISVGHACAQEGPIRRPLRLTFTYQRSAPSGE